MENDFFKKKIMENSILFLTLSLSDSHNYFYFFSEAAIRPAGGSLIAEIFPPQHRFGLSS